MFKMFVAKENLLQCAGKYAKWARRIWLMALLFMAVLPLTGTSSSDWTILVYMAADNGLSDYAIQDINDMESIQLPSGTNVIVQADFHATSEPHGAFRYKISPDNSTSISSQVLSNLGEIDSGDYRNLKSFIHWGFEHYPANKKALIIWSHADSWYKSQDYKWLCPDNGSENIMSVADGDLRNALADSPPLDVLLFDACSMQTLEVLAEVRSKTAYVIGSEDLVPATGFPYQDILPIWFGTPDTIAVQIPELYVNSYAPYGSQNPSQHAVKSTCSSIKTIALDILFSAMKEFSIQMRPNASLIREERLHCYNLNTYDAEVDFEEFIIRVENLGNIDTSYANLLRLIWQSSVIAKAKIEYSADIGTASIWFPSLKLTFDDWWEHYTGLNIYQYGWLSFLNNTFGEDNVAPDMALNLRAVVTDQLVTGNKLTVSWKRPPDPDPLGYYLSFMPEAEDELPYYKNEKNFMYYKTDWQTSFNIKSPGWLYLTLEDLTDNLSDVDSLYVTIPRLDDFCYIAPSPISKGAVAHFYYSIDHPVWKTYRLLIYDVSGKIVKEYPPCSFDAYRGVYTLDKLDNLAAGVYFAVMDTGGNNLKCKFAVIK